MKIAHNGKYMQASVLISAERLGARIAEVAGEINRDLGDEDPLVVLMVLHGALLFTADLVRHLSMPTIIESVRVRSYHGLKSSGNIELLTPVPSSVVGKNVLVVEDIVDSGRSIAFVKELLHDHKAKSCRICTLLDKPEAHLTDIQIDYAGFSIGTNFVIGFGLDLDGRYRNLPYIAELKPE